MRFVDAAALDRLLDFPQLIAALDQAFRGGVIAPTRHHHTIPRAEGDATLLLMPAWTEGAAAALGTKVVTVFPGNATLGLASVNGLYLLMDGATGTPRAVMDGARLTLWRTAAASALASRAMARPDAAHLLMVGAGALAPYLIRAHASVRRLRRIALWNRSPEAAQRLAQALATEGLPVVAIDALEPEARQADLISCATLSTTPLIRGAWLKPGAHLDLVGAFTRAMREADDEALQRARVLVDTPAALTEGGDVAVAIAAGAYRADQVSGTLFDLAQGRVAGRAADDEITLFKSVGASLEDLAAAMLVDKLSQAEG
jgi:ornithine cyclodeaminase